VAFVPLEELADIEGFDEDVAEELRERARNYLERREEEMNEKRRELGVADDLFEVEGVSAELAVMLGEQGVKSRDDLADLAADELIEMAPGAKLSLNQANDIIMAARAHWFADEDGGEGAGEA
jgi:N utilization substance protein A